MVNRIKKYKQTVDNSGQQFYTVIYCVGTEEEKYEDHY